MKITRNTTNTTNQLYTSMCYFIPKHKRKQNQTNKPQYSRKEEATITRNEQHFKIHKKSNTQSHTHIHIHITPLLFPHGMV